VGDTMKKSLSRYPRLSLRHSRGVALIEALIGMLIFSIGVLGLVGLQVSMTRAQTSAKFRTDAAFLSNELMGQLWGDSANLASYVTTPGSNCSYQRCADWVNKVSTGLPSGVATTAVDTSTGMIGMTLTWSVPEEGSHTYAFTGQVTR